MKGIVMAGGRGTRLSPLTRAISKQLVPIADRPLIYFPLTLLLQAGVREILVISTPRDLPAIECLLGDGTNLGCRFAYAPQEEPRGIADGLRIGRDFLAGEPVAMVLGDTLVDGPRLPELLQTCLQPNGAIVFALSVPDPRDFGVVTLDDQGRAVEIEEKPQVPRSNLAVPGLYFYDHRAVEVAWQIAPSERGELEISSVNREYLRRGALEVRILGNDVTWIDAGSFAALRRAADYVRRVEQERGVKVGCIEEVAYRQGFIDRRQLRRLAEIDLPSAYGAYLQRIADSP